MKNLDMYIKSVWTASDINEKRKAFRALVEVSHAKKATKILALRQCDMLSGPKLDTFASNFAMSGEGLKVR